MAPERSRAREACVAGISHLPAGMRAGRALSSSAPAATSSGGLGLGAPDGLDSSAQEVPSGEVQRAIAPVSQGAGDRAVRPNEEQL